MENEKYVIMTFRKDVSNKKEKCISAFNLQSLKIWRYAGLWKYLKRAWPLDLGLPLITSMPYSFDDVFLLAVWLAG